MTTQTPTFSLKVKIKNCTTCQNKVTRRLRKIPGVESASYDTEQGLVKISGDVDSNLLMKQLADWQIKAELESDLDPDHDHIRFPIGIDDKVEINENLNFNWIINPRPKKNGILRFIRKVSELTKIVRLKKSKVEVIKPWQFPTFLRKQPGEKKKKNQPDQGFPQFPPLYAPPTGYPFSQIMMHSQVPHYGSYGVHSMFAQPPLQTPMWGPSMQQGPPGGTPFYHSRSPGRMFPPPMTHYTRYEDNYY